MLEESLACVRWRAGEDRYGAGPEQICEALAGTSEKQSIPVNGG